MEPPAGERLGGGRGVIPVPGHQGRRPVDDLADLPDRDVVVVLVDDAGRHGGHDLAHRAEFAQRVLAQQHGGHRRHLGLAEGGDDVAAGEGLRHLAQQGVRGGGRAPGQRAQVEHSGPGLLLGAYRLPLGRNQEEAGHFLGFQHVEKFTRVERSEWVDDGGRTEGDGGQHVPDAGDVKQRHPDEADVMSEVRRVGVDRRHDLSGQIRVGEHRPLGMAGGAGGVHDQRRAVRGDVDRWGGLAVFGDEVLVAQYDTGGCALGDDEAVHGGQFTHRRGDGGQHRFGHHDGCAAVLHQIGQLRRREPEVNRNSNGAKLIGGEADFDEFRAIEHQDHHAVAGSDATAVQCRREPADAAVEFSPRDGAAGEAQCGRVRLHQRMPGQVGDPILPTRQIGLLGAQRVVHCVLACSTECAARQEMPEIDRLRRQ